MGLLIRALGLAATTALGWLFSDVFNEYQTTEQTQRSVGGAFSNASKSRGGFWVGVAVMAFVFGLLWYFIKDKFITKEK